MAERLTVNQIVASSSLAPGATTDLRKRAACRDEKQPLLPSVRYATRGGIP